MNFQPFFDAVTDPLFYGSLPSWQSQPMERLIAEGARRNRCVEDIAYALSTGYHETQRWKYDSEIGEGLGHDYGEPIWLIRGVQVAYYGRSDVQLTWLRNYAKMSVFLSIEHGRPIDLVNKPDLASEPEYSSLIMWEGMVRGMFTGKNLADYIRPGQPDYVGARRIINGMDKASKIARYAEQFQEALGLIRDRKT